MGVNTLWSYIKRNEKALVTYVDLVEVAKAHSGRLKILVDFYCFEHFIIKHFWRTQYLLTKNDNLRFCGGEYQLIDLYIKEFIKCLRAVNIELVFFLDGAKGSSQISSEQKLRTWKSRYHDELARLKKCFGYLRGTLPLKSLDLDHLTRPVLQEVQNVLTIQECGCEVHVQVSGEADNVIARHLLNDPGSYAVMSGDTDFCIFPDCAMIAPELFDVHNNLSMSQQCLRVPTSLVCGLIRTERVMQIFNFPDHKSLIEFATISGNDFTSPILKEKSSFKTQYMGQLGKMAGMIVRNQVAEKCDFFGELIAKDPDLQQAVAHSRLFYSLQLEEEEDKEISGPIYNLLAADIRGGRLSSSAIAMFRGQYWHRQVMEDPSPGLPCAEVAMIGLRSHIYAIILPANLTTVTEIGRTEYRSVEEITVKKTSDRRVPNIMQIKKNSSWQNMFVFETIIQHQERYPLKLADSYFHLHGMRMGFVCFLLRYFLLLNWRQNLFLSPQEFLVLAAWVLGQHEDEYHRLNFVPSPRCVTVENWFLVLYRNAYAFLGNLLALSPEFPTPQELFSGAVWVAMYMARAACDAGNPEARRQASRNIPLTKLREINSRVNRIIDSNIFLIRSIVRGMFEV